MRCCHFIPASLRYLGGWAIGQPEMDGLLVMCNRSEVLDALTTYSEHLLPESQDDGQPSPLKLTQLFGWLALLADMASSFKLIEASSVGTTLRQKTPMLKKPHFMLMLASREPHAP